MRLKASVVPAVACRVPYLALLASQPPADCVSGALPSCPRKCTQIIHSRVHDLLYFRDTERCDVAWTAFVLLLRGHVDIRCFSHINKF